MPSSHAASEELSSSPAAGNSSLHCSAGDKRHFCSECVAVFVSETPPRCRHRQCRQSLLCTRRGTAAPFAGQWAEVRKGLPRALWAALLSFGCRAGGGCGKKAASALCTVCHYPELLSVTRKEEVVVFGETKTPVVFSANFKSNLFPSKAIPSKHNPCNGRYFPKRSCSAKMLSTDSPRQLFLISCCFL